MPDVMPNIGIKIIGGTIGSADLKYNWCKSFGHENNAQIKEKVANKNPNIICKKLKSIQILNIFSLAS